jgi:hypothetical protein
VNTNLIVVAQRKFACGELVICCLHSILVSKLLILLEHTFISEQEPAANTKCSFWEALLGSEAIVMKGESRVKVTSKLAQLESLTHLELRLSKPLIGRLLDVHPCRCKILTKNAVWHLDVRQIPRRKHTIDEGTLGSVLVRRLCRRQDTVDAGPVIFVLTMLAQKTHHAHAVHRRGITLRQAFVIMLLGLGHVVRLFEEHTNAILRPRVAQLCRFLVAVVCLPLVNTVPELSEF